MVGHRGVILHIVCVIIAVACCISSEGAAHGTNFGPFSPHVGLGGASPSEGHEIPPTDPTAHHPTSGEAALLTRFPNTDGELASHTRNSFVACTPCANSICTCSDPYGLIDSPAESGSQTYDFDDTSLGMVTVMVWANKSEISGLNESDCYFKVGNTTFNNETYLNDVTTLYITTEDFIVVENNYEDCVILLRYAAVKPNISRISVTGTEGSFSFPSSDDQLGDPWGYPFQQRLAYIFNYSDIADTYVIDLDITHLDLGYSSVNIHGYPPAESVTNDFLLVGIGTEILNDTGLVFYGSQQSLPTIRLNSATAYVVFYGTYHEQMATGFTIHYSAANDTRLKSPTTTPPPPTSSLPLHPTTWAPIDGATHNAISVSAMTSSFCAVVAERATEYINETGLPVDPPKSVSPEDVLVYDVATCSPTTCGDACAAFNFSINKTRNGIDWAFSQHDLEVMVRDSDLEKKWSDMCDGCEFCEEEVEVPWWGLGGLLLVLLLIVVVLTAVVWRGARSSDNSESHDQYNTIAALETHNARRRSSGDVSAIGADRSSYHRRSLASFRRGRPDQEPQFSVEHYDIAGFTMYDNDEFEFESDAVYTNAAYRDTEPDAPAFDFWDTDHRRRSWDEVLQAPPTRGKTTFVGETPSVGGTPSVGRTPSVGWTPSVGGTPSRTDERNQGRNAREGADGRGVNRLHPNVAVLKVDVHEEYGEETEL